MPAKSDRHIRNVRLRFADDIGAMKRRTRAQMTQSQVDALGAALATYIATYIEQHGYGPSRRESAAAVGIVARVPTPPADLPSRFLPQWQAEGVDLIFLHLRHAGWIAYTQESRSLRPGSRISKTSAHHDHAQRHTAS